MELKRYELQCSFGRGMYEYKNGKYVKLSDIKKFFGIGKCSDCICFDLSWNCCKLFSCSVNNRCEDCIKTFGE